MNTLYLASGSAIRKKLLTEAKIPFKILTHCSHETVGEKLTIEKRVAAIAHDKMACIELKGIPIDQPAFVLTADTLVGIGNNTLGKPKDLADARRMIALMRDRDIQVVTACCLSRQGPKRSVPSEGPRLRAGSGGHDREGREHDAVWVIEQQTEWTTSAICKYVIPEELVDEYFYHVPNALSACGGCVVEGYGQQFLKSITGSYSAVLGLPMTELREHLEAMGFFGKTS